MLVMFLSNSLTYCALAGLDPAIHAFILSAAPASKSWMPGSSPGKGELQILKIDARYILALPN
jgi:hypothetical protein